MVQTMHPKFYLQCPTMQWGGGSLTQQEDAELELFIQTDELALN